MVVAEDVVSYFQGLKSYERIWMMCTLQHSCLPFELRFLGTCLEELGRKDFHELRPVENEANSTAEISLSELRKISNKHVQKKIILYLSLLHSHNYSCSNSLFKILCDSEEVNTFLKFESIQDEDEILEQLLMIYTLAVNHPAFSCEQKQILQGIFSDIQIHQSKRLCLKRNPLQGDEQQTVNPTVTASITVQECPLPLNTSPENTFLSQQLPNPSHLPTVPSPYAHDLSITMREQMTIGHPGRNFVRFPFPAGAWNATAIPLVFSTAEPNLTTHSSFVSRSSSPSISNSPSRSSSPTAKARPLSAPFPRPSQLAAPLTHQPVSLPLPQTNVDMIGEMVNKETSQLPVNALSNFDLEQLLRLTDEQLTELGMAEEAIQQLRCMAVDKKLCINDISSTSAVHKTTATDAETEAIKEFIGKSVPTTGLIYSPSMAVGVDPNIPTYTVAHPCTICICSGQTNGSQMNGFVSLTPAEIVPRLENDMNMLRLETDVPSRNSNDSNSDTASSDHSSPPNTPVLSQNIMNKSGDKFGGTNEWHHNMNSNHNSNNGDSSSEEKNSVPQSVYQSRGRLMNNRGRSKNQNNYARGRGNTRRRNENLNGTNEDTRKPNFSNSNTDVRTFQYTNPVTATVANATYMQPPGPYLRYNHSFPNNYLRAPSHHHYPNGGEILYHQYPPPQAIFPGAIQYPPVVMPKLSCHNCGTQGHFSNDCTESTLEDASKHGQYRLDYTPVEGGTFNEK